MSFRNVLKSSATLAFRTLVRGTPVRGTASLREALLPGLRAFHGKRCSRFRSRLASAGRAGRLGHPSAALVLLFSLTCGVAIADGQVRVQYDAAQTVACHDVTNAEFLLEHPEERLWEAKLEISSLISGGEGSLRHFFYQVDAVNSDMVFVDYLPHTTLTTRYAEPLNVEKKHEKVNTIGVSVAWDTIVKASPSANSSKKKSTQIRYSLLPPKEQVAASGTRRRGRGVYFKLKPSSQHTLEGAKEFAVVFRAPKTWRAGAMLLRCQAEGAKKSFFRTESYLAGSSMFMLAMYCAGDPQARVAAEEYAGAELELRRVAHQSREEIADRQSAKPRFPLAEPSSPQVPAGWLERLLISPGDANWPKYASHLPAGVRESGVAFLRAKQQLDALQ